MKKQIVCRPLLDFFNDFNNQFNVFMYDPNGNMIFVLEDVKTNKELHEQLFIELQAITDQLNRLKCNYSIDATGNILLECDDNSYGCELVK